MFATHKGVDEHKVDLRDGVAHVHGLHVLVTLSGASAKVASHVSRFQRHLVSKIWNNLKSSSHWNIEVGL